MLTGSAGKHSTLTQLRTYLYRKHPMNPYTQHLDKIQVQSDLITWYARVKRDMPWRRMPNPYYTLVSETMLQQTQVAMVIPYFERFVALFPDPQALAVASEEALLKAWEGLGYYRRARNLQTAAQMIVDRGNFPDTHAEILTLKGVGPYTAGAIASIAFGIPAPAVDGNVFRVISRLCAIYDDIMKSSNRKVFEQVVSTLICHQDPSSFNQGLMELGATVCKPKSPNCSACPFVTYCKVYNGGLVSELPVKTKPVKQTHVQLAVGVVQNQQGQVLISKRASTGLLADFYELVQVECPTREQALATLTEHLGSSGYSISESVYIGQFKHVFTHRVWHMHAYAIGADAAPEPASHQVWIDMSQLGTYSLAVAHQRILEQWVGLRMGKAPV